MSHVIAETALLNDGFARDVRIDIDDAGTIVAVTPASGPALEGVFKGVLLPGMTDLHSHAFQRSFAGRTGIAHPHDDFWSWREAMYRAAGAIQPDSMRAIAAYLAMRLLEGGYTSLVEFHYLFNQPDGSPYASRTVMADAVIEGAQSAGIGLTLLYGIYETGGVDGRPLEGGQRRFANTADRCADHAFRRRRARQSVAEFWVSASQPARCAGSQPPYDRTCEPGYANSYPCRGTDGGGGGLREDPRRAARCLVA